ncbi:phosphotransferase [Roseomonas sp. BN140053]|uniref:phosphotransferase n=1 Tax=Roseomonas sp. BN140053 TaxID=3391898 RepID=UPI0039E98BB7
MPDHRRAGAAVLSPPLGRDRIAALVPHAGSMCLLDRVESWDAECILCAATSHRDPANPLRRAGRLSAVCGVEYALQAMALHGALTAAGEAQPAGFLASLRELTLGAATLDGVAGELRVSATALARESRAFAYDFEVSAGEGRLLSGHAVIMLPVA